MIDLRSDTVTRPTEGMRAAMAAAVVGDDVYGEDPTVNALQERVAGMLGFETGLFVSSGTQSNLAALMSHCQRGEEVILGSEAHSYRYEAGGLAVLGSIQPQVVANRPDGTLDLAQVEAAVKPEDPHFARTRLLALENTLGGKALPVSYMEAATAHAKRRGLATHLDGARLFNAAVKLGVPARDIAQHFDSVSVCFSNGLGAPVGSALVGSRDLIRQAHKWRKMLGGGLRQAGVLAAAALHALDHHIERLADDHALARRFAEGLQGIPGLAVEPPHTNMVFVEASGPRAAGLVEHLKSRGVLTTGVYQLRFVTHLDVDAAGIDRAIAAVREHFNA